jgi:hypothetical protein
MSCIGLLGSLTISAIAATDNTNALGTKTYEQFPVTLNLAASQPVNVTITKANGQFSVTLPNQTKQVLAGVAADLANSMANIGTPPLTVADYNFDGYQDIATYGGMEGMVNAQYNLYLWNPSKQNFNLFKGDTTNLELDATHQLAKTSSRSGPRWFETYYASDQGKLYKAIETAMVSAGSQEVGVITHKNKAGAITQTFVTDMDMSVEDKAEAVKAKVQAAKVSLYDQPKETSKTVMYLIKGDEVILRELAGVQNDIATWCLINYEGKKSVTKWLKCENL